MNSKRKKKEITKHMLRNHNCDSCRYLDMRLEGVITGPGLIGKSTCKMGQTITERKICEHYSAARKIKVKRS